MSDFEKYLSNPIPLIEAAEFFVGLKKQAKDETLMAECVEEATKVANMMMPTPSGAQMGAAAMGNAMPPAPPPPPTPAAMGQHSTSVPPPAATKMGGRGAYGYSRDDEDIGPSFADFQAEVAAEKERRAQGDRLRGMTANMSPEQAEAAHMALRKKLTARGESQGGVGGAIAGGLVGGIGGAAAGSLVSHPLGPVLGGLGGAALGGFGGHRLGKAIGGVNGESAADERIEYAKMPQPYQKALLDAAYEKMAGAKVDPREVGKARGEAAAAARVERESHRGGERVGDLVGRVAGGAAGLAAGAKASKGNAGVALGGAALGQFMGGRVGKEVGLRRDSSKFKKASEVMKTAFAEMGGMEQPPPQQEGIQPIIDPATEAYLKTEMQAEELSSQAQLDQLRGTIEQAKAEVASSQQQLEQLQAQADSSQAEKEMMQQQVMEATNNAVAAQDEVLKHQQASAAMRMAIQQMRGRLLEVASTDPPALTPEQSAMAMVPPAPTDMSQVPAGGTQGADAASAAPTAGAPSPEQGPAGQAGSPAAQPNSAPPGGEQSQQSNQGNSSGSGGSSSSKETKPSVRVDVKSGGESKEGSVDELALRMVKNAVSHSWVRSTVSQGARKADESRVHDFVNNMGRMKTRNMYTGSEAKARVRDLADDASRTAEKVLGQKRVDALTKKAAGPFDGGGVREAVGNVVKNQASKLRSVLPHAAVGGALGAGLGFAESQASNDPLRQKLQELESQGPPESLSGATNLAQLRARLTLGEFAENHPAAATLSGGMAGAVSGAQLGPSLVKAVREDIGPDLKAIYTAIRNRGANAA